MSMGPCTCGQCQLCRVQDGWARESADNVTLRARVEELEGELAREREDSRDIPTIAYMSGAADWKARATRAEAERDEAIGKCCKWRPISEAPRDGTHILAWDGNRSAHHFDSHPPTVVHWFADGFYPSVSEIGNQPAYQATVWTELDERPALEAALAECGEG